MNIKVLTNEQIIRILEENRPECDGLDKTIAVSRAIEQAILQSEQVQAWRRDAERYRLLRDGQIDDIAVVRGLGATDYGSSGVIGIYEEEIGGDDLDEVIDHAQRIEGQT